MMSFNFSFGFDSNALIKGGGGQPDLTYAFIFNGEPFTFGGVAFTYGAP